MDFDMTHTGTRFLLVISSLCFIIAQAQLLIPLYGACTSSVQCVGVAICINQVCQCPPGYNAFGITCVFAGVDNEGAPVPALGPPVPIAANPRLPLPSPSLAVGVGQPPPPPGTLLSYPGLPCPPGKICVGNSICVQGICGCPAGQVVAGYSCVPPPPVAGGPPLAPRPTLPVAAAPYFPPYAPFPGDDELEFLFGPRGPGPAFPPPLPYPATCPPSQVPLGPTCVPPTSIVNYPSPISCQPSGPAPCPGGAVCVGSYCCCMPPLVWSGSACVPPPPPQAAPSSPVLQYVYQGPAPSAVRPAMPMVAPGQVSPTPIPLGAQCTAHNQCVFGAYCRMGVCQCRPAFLPYGSICVLRRRAKDGTERNEDKKNETND